MFAPPTRGLDTAGQGSTNASLHTHQQRQLSGVPQSASSAARQQPQTPNPAVSRSVSYSGGPGAPTFQGGPQMANNSGSGANPASTAEPPGAPVAFLSARAVTNIPEASLQTSVNLPPAQLFNPKAESPSIRRTPGIDHTSSRPLAKSGQHVAPTASQTTSAATVAPSGNNNGNAGGFTPVRPAGVGGISRGNNMVNPALDNARRIGAPGGSGGSPLANRGSYKPPSMKRPPLADLPPNGGAGMSSADKTLIDAKRQKTG